MKNMNLKSDHNPFEVEFGRPRSPEDKNVYMESK